MKCDSCGGQDAVIHIRQIIGSEVQDLHICQKCAAEKGILTDKEGEGVSLPSLLNGLIEDIVPMNNTVPESCPRCGMKRDDVDAEGRIGCPDCINAFGKEIRRSLKKRGLTANHKGKLPRGLETVKTLLFDKEVYKTQLKKAIAEEDYETAAKLRDKIHDIEERAGVPHEQK